MIVLLPPSEGKAPGGRGRWSPASGSFAQLGPARAAVADAVLAAPPTVFGAGGELAERAAEAARAVVAGTARALPAWQRFTGVVWQHLDPATLPSADRRRIVVPTGLLGLCRGNDPTPDFRLKLSVSLPGLGRLDRWWRPRLTEALATGRGPIVDLLPVEHAASLDLGALGRRRVVRVGFAAADGGGAAGHAAKAVKGILARRIILEGLDVVDGFTWQGWRAERDGDVVVVQAAA